MSIADNRLRAPLAASLERPRGAWRGIIDAWRAGSNGRALESFVDDRVAAAATVYPAHPLRALELTPLERTRVVLLGQDPYHGPGQAEGLAFSVPPGVRPPPSLRNIFKELQRDLGLPLPSSGHLGAWTERGVLLLNTTLTVEDGQPGSHAERGWEALTFSIVSALTSDVRPKVFLLWGAHAHGLAPCPAAVGPHLLLHANHPSPLAATRPPWPFLGCSHFSRASAFLARARPQDGPMDWRLP